MKNLELHPIAYTATAARAGAFDPPCGMPARLHASRAKKGKGINTNETSSGFA